MSEKVAFLFPGQGSQAVGMGADVAATSPLARSVLALADAALEFPLSRLCFSGPEETLKETSNAQPAMVAVSLALLAALQEHAVSTSQIGGGRSAPDASAGGGSLALDAPAEGGSSTLNTPLRPDFVAGHSVGEYSALVVAGALGLRPALQLVRERGRLMSHEGTVCPGGMAAVIGIDEETLRTVCAEVSARSVPPGTHPGLGKVSVANYNSPGQTVISGERGALETAMRLLKERGAKRVIALPVSGAFHSPVMQPAAEGLAAVLAGSAWHDPSIPVISNITGEPLTRASELREELARQISSPVQWTKTIETLADAGVRLFVEIGAGQVLSGLVKRIVKDARVRTVNGVADLAGAAKEVRACQQIK